MLIHQRAAGIARLHRHADLKIARSSAAPDSDAISPFAVSAKTPAIRLFGNRPSPPCRQLHGAARRNGQRRKFNLNLFGASKNSSAERENCLFEAFSKAKSLAASTRTTSAETVLHPARSVWTARAFTAGFSPGRPSQNDLPLDSRAVVLA